MKPITVILRYDDFSSQSPTAVEQGILDVLRRHGLPCVFGVVPLACPEDSADCLNEARPLPEDKVRLLREVVDQGLVEPALHGLRHHRRARTDRRGKPGDTEFQGLEQAEQLAMLRQGKALLAQAAGREPECFIPPYNSYDRATLAALEQAGLTCLSAAMFDEAPEGSSLAFLPHSCNLGWLRAAVLSARAAGDDQAVIMALFHAFDFKESGSPRARLSLPDFSAMLGWLKDQRDVRVVTVSQVLRESPNLGAARFRDNRRFLKASLHPWVPDGPWASARTRYLGRALSRRFLRLLLGITALSYLGVAALALALGVVLALLPGDWWRLAAGILAAANAFWWVALAARRKRVYFNAARLTVFLAAALVGFLAR